MVIRPKDGVDPGSTLLNLNEVTLRDPAGNDIPAASLRHSIVRPANGSGSAGCLNGDAIEANSTVGCAAIAGPNEFPYLVVGFDCPGSAGGAAGSASGSLSVIIVENRRSCCQAKITDFQVDFYNSSSGLEVSLQPFDTPRDTYKFALSRSLADRSGSCGCVHGGSLRHGLLTAFGACVCAVLRQQSSTRALKITHLETTLMSAGCASDSEIVGGVCMPPCGPNAVRLSSGDCGEAAPGHH